jgi:mono/diheme cytochrome c family protein
MKRTAVTLSLLALAGGLAVAACTLDYDVAVAQPTGPAQPRPWTTQQKADWYAGQQGSRLMPLAWMRALEQPSGGGSFLDNAYIESFGLLPQSGRLPVGFAVDDADDTRFTFSKLRWFERQPANEPWIGLTCAACHTGEVRYKGEAFRIDGGPSLFDYQSFIEALDTSLHATLTDQARFGRFAGKVLCTGQADASADGGCTRNSEANRSLLRGSLKKLVDWEDRVERMNQTGLRYGYGRVDAFGHIFNKVALFVTTNSNATPTPNPASAPVSYPFLWDIYRHDKLQWNGIVGKQQIGSIDFGALGRNTGEVIGVFGDVNVVPGAGVSGYDSSVRVVNLERIERQLTTLPAPRWPAQFGRVDDTPAKRQALAAGKALFDAQCVGCHRSQPGRQPYKVTMVPLRRESPDATDPWMACNSVRYRSAPGSLVGTRNDIIRGDAYTAAPAPIAAMLSTVVKGVLFDQKAQIVRQMGRVYLGVGGRPTTGEEAPFGSALDACFDSGSPLMAYKARPLDGIWATAPYLHNGSVPNLYQLLLPPQNRLAQFKVGTREYDPVDVGYSLTPAPGERSFTFDTTLPGNSNQGHVYGVGALTEPQRRQLLAYLKTL